LPRRFTLSSTVLPQLTVPPISATTPFAVANLRAVSSFATREILRPLSRELEDRGVRAAEPTVLLTTFQHGENFDVETRRRYSKLAAHGVLTAAFGHGMPLAPGPHIRGCPLLPDDPLVGEWNVIVIGSTFAGGMFAKQRSISDFDLILSQDRDLVLDAARPLLQRLPPA
jgi:hypothetical protein